MLPVGAQFLAVLRGSHDIVATVALVTPGQTGTAPAGTTLAHLGGQVTLDAGADVRGSLSVELAEAWPAAADAAHLTPYGAELFVTRGVKLGNGRIQRAPLGYYRVTNVEQDDAPAGPLTVTAQDRMSAIVEAKLLAPAQYLAYQSLGFVVVDLVQAVLPGQVIEWDDAAVAARPVGRPLVCEEDRFAFLRDLVTAAGKVMYFDYRGVLVIKTPPDPTVPVWDADAGHNGVLVKAGRGLTREGVYNAVAAEGEALDEAPPVTGYAYDLDPASPTYWAGPFGKVPRRYSSPFLTTSAQATSAAAAILAQSKGLPYEVDFSAVPNPALEPLDAVRLTWPPQPGLNPRVRSEIHVLDQIGIPLAATGDMPAKTRASTINALA